MTDFVKLKAALPADSRNGLAEHAEHIATNGDQPMYALVRLDLDEVRERKRDGRRTAVLMIGHIEPLSQETPASAVEDLGELIAWAEEQAAARREMSGQQPIPTERDELLAELAELADDLTGVTAADLDAEYGDTYGVPPSGDPDVIVNLRTFIAGKRADLRLPERTDATMPGDAEVVFSSETTAP